MQNWCLLIRHPDCARNYDSVLLGTDSHYPLARLTYFIPDLQAEWRLFSQISAWAIYFVDNPVTVTLSCKLWCIQYADTVLCTKQDTYQKI